MWPFSRKEAPYQRSAVLEAAARARASGNVKKAIAEYQKVIANEPDNTDVHGKLAPLLAESGQFKPAWKSFELSAEGFRKKGFVDRAISVYMQAAEAMPGLVEVWERVAAMHLERRRRADAVKALLRGRSFFKTAEYRPQAIRLLGRVRDVEPMHYDATRDLAGLLGKDKRAAEAVGLLEALGRHHKGAALRRIRGQVFWLHPGPRRAWEWVRALFVGR